MAVYTIDKVETYTLSTTEKEIPVNYGAVFIENLTADNVLYFKEKSKDGVAVTVGNGFALPGGNRLEFPLRAKVLSVKASAANTDVRLLYVKEEK